eukprot:4473709-Prymnesium_polylepis.2
MSTSDPSSHGNTAFITPSCAGCVCGKRSAVSDRSKESPSLREPCGKPRAPRPACVHVAHRVRVAQRGLCVASRRVPTRRQAAMPRCYYDARGRAGGHTLKWTNDSSVSAEMTRPLRGSLK